MNKNSPSAASGFYWQKTGKKRMPLAENLLREHECRCVAACHRFIKRGSSPTAVWNLHDRDSSILALLLYSNRNLLPVFCGHTAIPDPKFLKKIFRLLPVHSAQGLAADVIFLEGYLAKCGLEASDKIDYHLMCINDLSELNEACLQPPGPNSQRGTAVPPLSTLILREAQN
ncbi:MAG: hypothetical protein FWF29_08445, partial [Treponema sp.]|nr:hypothetical protein [Treponema sp.]